MKAVLCYEASKTKTNVCEMHDVKRQSNVPKES